MARIYEYLDANNDKRNILSLHGISLKLKVFLLISSNVLKAICGDMWISDHYKQGGQGFSLGISKCPHRLKKYNLAFNILASLRRS